MHQRTHLIKNRLYAYILSVLLTLYKYCVQIILLSSVFLFFKERRSHNKILLYILTTKNGVYVFDCECK